MNKIEFIDAVAKNADMTKVDTTKFVDAALGVIEAALKKGDEVRLINFGTFCVAHRKATVGRNPRTGDAINIPETRVAKFRPGKGLKDALAK